MNWLQAYLPRPQTPSSPSAINVEIEPPQIHPYYPSNLPLKGYIPNDADIQSVFLKVSAIVVASTISVLLLLRRVTTTLKTSEKLTILWFLLSGFLHTSFEQYLVKNHQTLAGKLDVYAQLWKEYALSDSRYLASDTFVICIETITVFVWGPLCLLVALLVARKSVYRFPAQAVVCVAHLYGDVLYYATSLYDARVNGIEHSRPEPVYFWGYFVGLNAVWIVVPAVLLCQSIWRIGGAFRTLAQIEQLYVGREHKKREASERVGGATKSEGVGGELGTS